MNRYISYDNTRLTGPLAIQNEKVAQTLLFYNLLKIFTNDKYQSDSLDDLTDKQIQKIKEASTSTQSTLYLIKYMKENKEKVLKDAERDNSPFSIFTNFEQNCLESGFELGEILTGKDPSILLLKNFSESFYDPYNKRAIAYITPEQKKELIEAVNASLAAASKKRDYVSINENAPIIPTPKNFTK